MLDFKKKVNKKTTKSFFDKLKKTIKTIFVLFKYYIFTTISGRSFQFFGLILVSFVLSFFFSNLVFFAYQNLNSETEKVFFKSDGTVDVELNSINKMRNEFQKDISKVLSKIGINGLYNLINGDISNSKNQTKVINKLSSKHNLSSEEKSNLEIFIVQGALHKYLVLSDKELYNKLELEKKENDSKKNQDKKDKILSKAKIEGLIRAINKVKYEQIKLSFSQMPFAYPIDWLTGFYFGRITVFGNFKDFIFVCLGTSFWIYTIGIPFFLTIWLIRQLFKDSKENGQDAIALLFFPNVNRLEILLSKFLSFYFFLLFVGLITFIIPFSVRYFCFGSPSFSFWTFLAFCFFVLLFAPFIIFFSVGGILIWFENLFDEKSIVIAEGVSIAIVFFIFFSKVFFDESAFIFYLLEFFSSFKFFFILCGLGLICLFFNIRKYFKKSLK